MAWMRPRGCIFGIPATAADACGSRRCWPGCRRRRPGSTRAPRPTPPPRRAAEVLEAMVETGAITRPRPAGAELIRMPLPPPASRHAGWFADWALDDLAETLPRQCRPRAARHARPADAGGGGSRGWRRCWPAPARGRGVGQGAVVVMDAATGAVRAMAGGRDYRASQFNRATQARRQPGSAFKPFVFLAALERGLRAGDLVADGPLNLGGWSPGNGGWRPRGEITLEEALAHSVNTAAVRVLLRARRAARRRSAMAARWALADRSPRCLAGARHRGGDADRAGGRLRRLRQWRAAA